MDCQKHRCLLTSLSHTHQTITDLHTKHTEIQETEPNNLIGQHYKCHSDEDDRKHKNSMHLCGIAAVCYRKQQQKPTLPTYLLLSFSFFFDKHWTPPQKKNNRKCPHSFHIYRNRTCVANKCSCCSFAVTHTNSSVQSWNQSLFVQLQKYLFWTVTSSTAARETSIDAVSQLGCEHMFSGVG